MIGSYFQNFRLHFQNLIPNPDSIIPLMTVCIKDRSSFDGNLFVTFENIELIPDVIIEDTRITRVFIYEGRKPLTQKLHTSYRDIPQVSL